MGKISWLHISDLHFGSGEDGSRKLIRDSLLEFVEKKKLDIDYLFITGDLIYAKELKTDDRRKKAYQDAYEYLKLLYTRIWKDSSAVNIWDRVFLVPGNHDVIRNRLRITNISGIKEDYIENGYESIDKSYEESFSSGFKAYIDNLPEEIKSKHPESCCATHYVTKTDKINILHIN